MPVWTKPVVEIAFANNPGEPSNNSVTWTDVSDYCIGPMTWTVGRNAEFDVAQAGSLSLTLDNRDRRFDPTHATGPYFGNLKARKRIRVTALGTTLFTGFVDGWPQSYDPFTQTATVELKAVDGMIFLATSKITGTPYEIQVRYDGPVAWFPLDEVDGLQARNLVNLTEPGQYANDGVKLNQDAGGVWEKAPYFFSAALPGGTPAVPLPEQSKGFGVFIADPLNGASFTGNQSIEFWVKVIPGSLVGLSQRTYAIAEHVSSVSANTERIAAIQNSCMTNRSTTGNGTAVDDGAWHYVAMTYDGSTRRIYIDGELNQSIAGATPLFGSATGFIGHFWGAVNKNTFYWNIIDVTRAPIYLRHIAYYSYVLTAAQIEDHYFAAYGFPEDFTGDRINRVLDWVGCDHTLHIIDDGASRLQPKTDVLSGFALDYIQNIARSERGLFFAQPDGKYRFRSRHFTNVDSNAKTVQMTFGDAGSDLRYVSAQPASDELFIFNDVAAQVEGGRRFVKEDATSIASFFRRGMELTGLLCLNDTEAEVLVGFILDLYKDPVDRIESLVFDARYSTSHRTAALTLALGHRVVINYKQMATGAQQSYTQIVEKITQRINWSSREWTVELVLSPIEIKSYFIIGTDTVGGSAVMTY